MSNRVFVIILLVSIMSSFIPITNNAMAQIAPTSSTIFATVQFPGGGPPGGSLYTLSPTTGAATLVGLLGESWGGGGCGAIDFHPITGVLYGICFNSVLGDSILVTISPTTGAFTSEIGPLGTFLRTPSMSFHPTTGVLYAVHRDPGFMFQELSTISLATGSATPVSGASIGPGQVFADGNAIAFNSAGTLFLSNNPFSSNNLYTLDLVTEAAVAVVIGSPFIGFLH